jgi:hypothetical protein
VARLQPLRLEGSIERARIDAGEHADDINHSTALDHRNGSATMDRDRVVGRGVQAQVALLEESGDEHLRRRGFKTLPRDACAGGPTEYLDILIARSRRRKYYGASRTSIGARGRSYFFAAAARAMRQVLVDHARRRSASKRGSGAVRVDPDDVQLAVDDFAVELLALNEALQRLAALSERFPPRRAGPMFDAA